jgi:hypothetical protein
LKITAGVSLQLFPVVPDVMAFVRIPLPRKESLYVGVQSVNTSTRVTLMAVKVTTFLEKFDTKRCDHLYQSASFK